MHSIHFAGANSAVPSPAVSEALGDPQLAAIIIAPSNPYLSIDPLLSMPALRAALLAAPAPVIAISPIIGGKAIKGPTAKIMRELGVEPSALAVARHYGELLDAFIVDTADSNIVSELQDLNIATLACNTLMTTLEDKINLARATLQLAQTLTR